MRNLSLCLLFIFLMVIGPVQAQNARRYWKAGGEFMEVLNYEDAIRQFTKSIELDPDFEKAYLSRANAYEKIGNLKAAVADYDRAATFDQKNTDIFCQAGKLYYEMGDYESAINRLNTSINLKKTNIPAYQYLIQTLIETGSYAEALQICKRALTIRESDLNFYYRGVVNEEMNNYVAAEEDFEKAIRKNKRLVEAYVDLADLRIKLNKFDNAMENVNKALELDPNNRKARYVRSKIYVKQLNYSNAIDDISKNILLNPGDEEMFFIRGGYYQDFTQHQSAINDFTKVILLNDSNMDAYYQRARSYEQIGNFQAAIRDYQKLAEISEDDEEARELLAKAEKRLFELNREANKPEIVIVDPRPTHEGQLNLPRGRETASIKGVVKDESLLNSLVVNDVNIPFVRNGEEYEFIASLALKDARQITVTAVDAYGNIRTSTYGIVRTEVEPPEVSILAPYASDNGEIYLDSNDPNLYVEGKISDESLIERIMINGVAASYKPDEHNPVFSATINVMNKNKFVVAAEDVYGNETITEFTLNRDAAALLENNPMGKTWAVFIENSSYQTFASLDGPIKDVSLMKAALAKYQVHNIIHKKDMTKKELERFFSIELRDLVRSNRVNSIMIWYAGHGKFINETGYWIPVDAERNDEFTYFNINALKASLQSYSNHVTHTLVITDACESGPSFYQAMRSIPTERSCDDWQATRFKSSQVFSSAGYELAVDDSQFTRTFSSALANNPNACIPIEKIVNTVTQAVVSNKQQRPQFGKIAGLEDENGTFFFISKEY